MNGTLTVVDTIVVDSHYIVSAAIPGSVATDAETNKCQKYNDQGCQMFYRGKVQMYSQIGPN